MILLPLLGVPLGIGYFVFHMTVKGLIALAKRGF